MLCSKCGYQSPDDAVSCQKCGEHFVAGETQMSGPKPMPAMQDSQNTAASSQSGSASPKTKTKKSKLPAILIGAALLVAILVIVIVKSRSGSVDYISTVRAHKPFVTQGTDLTYATVLNEYIVSAAWEERVSGNTGYVDISGKAKGTDADLRITITVSPDPNDSKSFLISPESVTVNGENPLNKNDAAEFLLGLFRAYEAGTDSLEKYLAPDEVPSGDDIDEVPPEDKLGEVDLSQAEKRNLNLFLSHFIEAYLYEYSAGTSDEILVNFAVVHNKLHDYSRFSSEQYNDEYYDTIEGSHIEETIKSFFGRDVTLGNFGNILYQDGKLYCPATDGEFYGCFAQVSSMEGLGGGEYAVTFEIYEAEYDYQQNTDLYDPVESWSDETKKHASSTSETKKAVVKAVNLDGKDTYQLISLE